MAVNFQALLSKPLDSVKRPPVKPAGTYFATVDSYKFDESRQKKTPFVRFVFKGMNPGQDIDVSQLRNDDGTPMDLSKWTPHFDFYLTDNSDYRLKEALEACGINTAGRTFAETIPEMQGKQVMLTCVLTPSEDGKEFYNNISEMKAAA